MEPTRTAALRQEDVHDDTRSVTCKATRLGQTPVMAQHSRVVHDMHEACACCCMRCMCVLWLALPLQIQFLELRLGEVMAYADIPPSMRPALAEFDPVATLTGTLGGAAMGRPGMGGNRWAHLSDAAAATDMRYDCCSCGHRQCMPAACASRRGPRPKWAVHGLYMGCMGCTLPNQRSLIVLKAAALNL